MKTAIITGAGRGIGKVIAMTLLERGVTVFGIDADIVLSHHNHYEKTSLGGFSEMCQWSEGNPNAKDFIPIEADLTSKENMAHAFTLIKQETDSVDMLVNGVGVTQVSAFANISEEEYHNIMNTNVTSFFFVSQLSLPLLEKGTTPSIVNISSISGRQGFSHVSHYCASKFAVVGLTLALARELAPKIRVNCVCPGVSDTNMWQYLRKKLANDQKTEEAAWQEIINRIPMGQAQTMQDIAMAVIGLAENIGANGAILDIHGGMQ